MAQHDRYISPFSTRYASDEMQYIFSEDNKFRTWRKLWIALAKAEKAQGLAITDEQIAELEAHQDDINDEHLIAISHGEGRFVCNEQLLNQLIDNGQIATQYVDLTCRPTMDLRYNPNGSVLAIEGITSPDGRVFGKMGHSERSGELLYKNVTGDKYQPIFEGGVNYFKL